jgi:uncharacterized protein YjeT (DUF2065 family)
MWQELLIAVALVMVIEGILPFLNPAGLRRTVETLAELDNRVIRGMGLISMVAGVAILYLVH